MARIVGDRVKELRSRKGWSQKKLLEEVKELIGEQRLSRNTLSEIENCTYTSEPGAWLLEALAQVLDTTADYLIGLADDPGVSIPSLPVPALDLVPLVARLNRLDPQTRKTVVRLVETALELKQASAEASTAVSARQFDRLLDSLSTAELADLTRQLEERLARARRRGQSGEQPNG